VSANLRAALTLTLKDELSSGLDKIKTEFEALKNLGRGLTLGHLEQGASVLRAVAQEARVLVGSLDRVAASANLAWGAIKRMGGNAMHGIGNALGPQSRVGAFAAAAEGYSVLAPVQHYASLEDEIRRIGIMKGLSGKALDAETTRLTKFLNHEALATGQTAHAGAETYIDLIKAGTPMAGVEEIIAKHHRAATAFYAKPEEFTRVTAALNNQFQIPHEQMDQALSAVGLAANLGQMTVSDFGQQFPRIAGMMTAKGMRGLKSSNMLLAMLDTQFLTAGNAGSAGAEVMDGIQYLYSPAAVHHFDQQTRGHGPGQQYLHGIVKEAVGGDGTVNLPKIMQGFADQGQNPVDGLLDLLAKWKKNLKGNETKFGQLMGALFGNEQSRNLWQTQSDLRPHRKGLEAQFNAVSPDKAREMFMARFGGPAVQLKLTGERLEQLTRRAGQGFLPVMKGVNAGLETFHHELEKADERFPGVADGFLVVAGGGLAFGAALAGLGVVGPLVAKGWGMIAPVFGFASRGIAFLSRGLVSAGTAGLEAAGLLTATGATIASVALIAVAAAADIYMNWDRFRPFFAQMGEGVDSVLSGIGNLFKFMGTLNPDVGLRAIRQIGEGIQTFLSGAIQTAIGLVGDLANGLNGLSGGMLFDVFKGLNDKLLEIGRSILGDRDKNQKKYEEDNKARPDTVPNRNQMGIGNPMGDQGGTGGNEAVFIFRAEGGATIDGKSEVRVRVDAAGRVLGRI
jgi:hypothetical protein